MGSVTSFRSRPHPEIKRKVRATLERILEDPKAGKALKEELQGLRIARLRVVHRIGKGGVVEIVAFGPRHRIYEETLRLLRIGKEIRYLGVTFFLGLMQVVNRALPPNGL